MIKHGCFTVTFFPGHAIEEIRRSYFAIKMLAREISFNTSNFIYSMDSIIQSTISKMHSLS